MPSICLHIMTGSSGFQLDRWVTVLRVCFNYVSTALPYQFSNSLLCVSGTGAWNHLPRWQWALLLLLQAHAHSTIFWKRWCTLLLLFTKERYIFKYVTKYNSKTDVNFIYKATNVTPAVCVFQDFMSWCWITRRFQVRPSTLCNVCLCIQSSSQASYTESQAARWGFFSGSDLS